MKLHLVPYIKMYNFDKNKHIEKLWHPDFLFLEILDKYYVCGEF